MIYEMEMEVENDYVNQFLKYIKTFVASIRPDDPLPVRAPNYKVTETEVDGQIIDIVYHYLSSKECPPYLRNLVAHRVWSAIRQPNFNNEDEEGYEVIDHGNQTFEPMKLIQDVTNRVNSEFKELLNQFTPSVIETLPRYLPVSQYAIKNTRRKMEDRHVIIHDLNTLYGLKLGEPHAFYAVFDGHAGPDAAVYSAALLHQYLIQNPMYESDPVSALKHAFYITDTNYLKKEEKERLKGGTTAVVALVRDKRLVVAWLGDSLALLVRKRTPVHIVKPHKPDDVSEQKRIEDAGGCVVHIQGTWRVLGQLAVSRAIGDGLYKPYVSSECDIKSLEICGDEDFLILACDGLWDFLSPERAVNLVFSYLLRNDGDTEGVGRCLVEAARIAGSEDNITAVVVFLRAIHVLMEEETTRISEGLVPDLDPLIVPVKGSLPPSIQSIFSPPEQPNPIADNCHTNGQSYHIPHLVGYEDECPEIPPRDYDSDDEGDDEGFSAVPDTRKDEFIQDTPQQPTEEEVHAVLAELDSIPETDVDADGFPRSEDHVMEEDGDDEDVGGWAYYQMQPQMIPREDNDFVEPMITNGGAVESFGIQNSDMVDGVSDKPTNYQSGSPSGSPRTVEGFVTSVELNTCEENFGTNAAVNRSSGYFGTGVNSIVEQNSGPFSVYVSSSPEPATSVDSLPEPLLTFTRTTLVTDDSGGREGGIVSSSMSVESNDLAAVEIVHAQSTVEVPASDDVHSHLSFKNISDEDAAVPGFTNNSEEPVQISSDDFTQVLVDRSNEIIEIVKNVEEPLTSIITNGIVAPPDLVSDIVSTKEDILPQPTSPKELQETASVGESDYLFNMSHKAFEVSLDPMAASFHEDQTPCSDLVSSLKQVSKPELLADVSEEGHVSDLFSLLAEFSISAQSGESDFTAKFPLYGSDVVKYSPVNTDMSDIDVQAPSINQEYQVESHSREIIPESTLVDIQDQTVDATLTPISSTEEKKDEVPTLPISVPIKDKPETTVVTTKESPHTPKELSSSLSKPSPKSITKPSSTTKTSRLSSSKLSTTTVQSSTTPKATTTTSSKVTTSPSKLSKRPQSAIKSTTPPVSSVRSKVSTSSTSTRTVSSTSSSLRTTAAKTSVTTSVKSTKTSTSSTSVTSKTKPFVPVTKRLPTTTKPIAVISPRNSVVDGAKSTSSLPSKSTSSSLARRPVASSSRTTAQTSNTTATTTSTARKSGAVMSSTKTSLVARTTSSTISSKSVPSSKQPSSTSSKSGPTSRMLNPSAKDAKNTTNRILSSSSSSVKPRTLPSKYIKTPGLRKKDPEKAKAVVPPSAENDKLAHEAAAVEVANKTDEVPTLSESAPLVNGGENHVQ